MISQVVASERERAQTVHVATHERCCRTTTLHVRDDRKSLEKDIGEGENPVREVSSGIVES